MSVSIHHIYSSVTLLFAVVLSAALLPIREHTGKDKVYCPHKEGIILPRMGQVFSSSHSRQITITLLSTVLVRWSPGIQRAL